MSVARLTQPILDEGRKAEREFDWLGAARHYNRALDTVSGQDASRSGEIIERLGHALYRAALQAETPKEFQERIQQATADYEKAKALYDSSRESGRRLRSEAMLALLGHWLASEVAEKKRLVDSAWNLTMEALNAFQETPDPVEYGRTHSQLSYTSHFAYHFESKFEDRQEIVKNAVKCGERGIAMLTRLGESDDLARAYVSTAGDIELSRFYTENVSDQEELREKAKSYWTKGKGIFEGTALEALPLAARVSNWDWSTGTDEATQFFNRVLDHCQITRDRLLIGHALEFLANQYHFRGDTTEDPEERSKNYAKWLRYAEEATRNYSSIAFVSFSPVFSQAPRSHYYWHMAQLETDISKRHELFEKSVEIGRQELEAYKHSGIPGNVFAGHLWLYMALTDFAKTEPNLEAKRKLLEEALENATQRAEASKGLEPFDNILQGVSQSYLGDIKSQLAGLVKDSQIRRNLLYEALGHKETAAKYLNREAAFVEKRGSLSVLARIALFLQDTGNLLMLLYEETHEKENLKRAAKSFEEVAQLFQRTNFASRAAECYWKAAQAHDALEEHLEAAENFRLASQAYRSAVENLPRLSSLYFDYAKYMDAWSEIEKARYDHSKQNYATAKEHYERASSLHKSTKQWTSLADDYAALAQVENAEQLSRKEQDQEAIHAFQEARRLFEESKKALRQSLDQIEDADTKQMATKLIKATDLREAYCSTRISLEEARVLDKKGEHNSAAEKYDRAAASFEKIIKALEFEQTKREVRLILTLTRAWEKMAMAEAEASPELCLDACKLFEAAKELSSDEKTKMLVLGHSRLCKALEAGTRFMDTREPATYTVAVQHLESAATYYVKAGFESASEYAGATRLLFDACMRVDQANRETDDEKKAKLYITAEKILQASSDSYHKAGHPGKKDQVLRLLDRIRKEKELALSVSELLKAPSLLSSTTAFSTPTPVHEKPVGLGRFDHADVQTHIVIRQRSLKVGESLEMEIEMVNAGKGAAQLIKLEEVIPSGFDLVEKPDHYRVEDGYINLKGRRLDSLKTEEVKLVLKSRAKGLFSLKPRILYLDEDGRYRSHEPEPIEVSVTELGISGWIKGH